MWKIGGLSMCLLALANIGMAENVTLILKEI
jgi:hypothetical protein